MTRGHGDTRLTGHSMNRRDSGNNTPPAAPRTPPFVGRESELVLLGAAHDWSASGSGRLVVIAGEPGIGKTWLCLQFEKHAIARGSQVLWGGNHEASGAPPYWPWLQAVRQWARVNGFAIIGSLRDSEAGELARVFPELADAIGAGGLPPVTETASAQFRLFEAMVALLRAMAARGPLVLVLEDLHWSDGPSLQLLQHVARGLPKLRIVVIATYRQADLARNDPLPAALVELNRDPGFDRVELHGLSADEVRAYVRAVTGVEPTSPVVEFLHRRTEGSPFLLAEVADLLTEEETLGAAGLPGLKIPRGARDTLGRRLDLLSEEARELLLLAAILGHEFTYEELDALRSTGTVGRNGPDRSNGEESNGEESTDDQLVAVIEQALQRAIIEEMDLPGRYRFTHALMRDTLLGQLSSTRRAFLHGRVAQTLEEVWGNRANRRASQLAAHFLESAALTPDHLAAARHYAGLAAQQAESQFAWSEAARWYRAATEGVDHPEPKYLRALANSWVNAFGWMDSAGIASFVAAVDAYRAAGDMSGLATTVADLPLGYLAFPFAGPLLQEAVESSSPIDPQVAATLRRSLCLRHMLLGQPEVTVAEMEQREDELLEFSNHPEVSDGTALGAWAKAVRATRKSDFLESARHFAEAAQEYERIGRPVDACEALLLGAGRAMVCGAFREGREYSQTLAALSAKYQHAMGRRMSDRNEFILDLIHRGDSSLVAPATLARINPDVPGAEVVTAWWTLVGGRRTEARAKLSPPADPQRMHRLWLLQAAAPRAAVLFDADGPEAARPDFEQWAALWRLGVSEPANRASTFALLARALPVMGDDAFCREVYEEVRYWRNWWGYGAGIGVDAGRGGLALRLGLWDDARQAFEDGMRWAEREGCPVEVGRNLAGLARVADHDGDIPLARALLDRSTKLFRRLGTKLYLDDVLAHRAELQAKDSPVHRMDGEHGQGSRPSTALLSDAITDGRRPSMRELEVLRLVATGLRNREIASQLVISERTVERHISNVYRKLDLRGKADATSWALRSGLL